MPEREKLTKAERTHAQIVEAAARAFRRQGVEGIGIAALMSSIGKTHGGFYAHFRDRDALVAEAAAHAAQESVKRLLDAADTGAPGAQVDAMVDFYLGESHCRDMERGCLLPAVTPEIARQAKPVRAAFTAALQSNIAQLAARMPGETEGERASQAALLISSMAGALMIARAVTDPKMRDWLLEAVSSGLKDCIKGSHDE